MASGWHGERKRHSVAARRGLSVADMKKINKEKGQQFFSRGAMRFFNSRIESGSNLHAGKYFITSERFDSTYPKKFTIHRFNRTSGRVEDVSNFQQYDTLKDARNDMKELN